jgi:hypothetical protein
MSGSLSAEDLIYEDVLAGIYRVTTDGEVWRLLRYSLGSRCYQSLPVPQRADERNRNGYQIVRRRRHSHESMTVCMAHRLVYRVFYGLIPEGLEVHHCNRCRYDNRADNLEVVTSGKNTEYATSAGSLGRTANGRFISRPLSELETMVDGLIFESEEEFYAVS